MSSTVSETASAVASGANATERFHSDKSPYDAVKDVPSERVDTLARGVLDSIYTTIRKHKVTYQEFNALKAWMINVGDDIASAVEPELILDPQSQSDGTATVVYGFVLDPEKG